MRLSKIEYNETMNIDIKKLKAFREELDSLNKEDVLYIDENGKAKYAILPIAAYDEIESLLSILNNKDESAASIKVANFDDIQLTYEEYENIRKQIIDAVDKTLKPNPEKLN